MRQDRKVKLRVGRLPLSLDIHQPWMSFVNMQCRLYLKSGSWGLTVTRCDHCRRHGGAGFLVSGLNWHHVKTRFNLMILLTIHI